MHRAYVYNEVRSLLAVFVAFEVLNDEDKNSEGERQGNGSEEGIKGDISTTLSRNWRSKTQRNITKHMTRMSHADFQRKLSYIEQDITRKQVLGGNKVISPKERLALTIRNAQNCLALLPSLYSWWPWLRLLNCACSTMLKERGKWLQLRFNIPNIRENKRNVERMLKQKRLKAFKLFQHRFNILSTRFNKVERWWQTFSTLPFNKIERMLKQMLKLFARALKGS